MDRLGRAGHDRHTRGAHRLSGSGLGAHHVDRLRWRTDPDESGRLACTCEVRILGEESVPGMNSFGTGPGGSLEQSLPVEVALGRRPGPDQVRLVRGGQMQRGTVGLRIDGDGSDSELAEGAEDADRDLTAVGDEDFREHGHSAHSRRRRPRPVAA